MLRPAGRRHQRFAVAEVRACEPTGVWLSCFRYMLRAKRMNAELSSRRTGASTPTYRAPARSVGGLPDLVFDDPAWRFAAL